MKAGINFHTPFQWKREAAWISDMGLGGMPSPPTSGRNHSLNRWKDRYQDTTHDFKFTQMVGKEAGVQFSKSGTNHLVTSLHFRMTQRFSLLRNHPLFISHDTYNKHWRRTGPQRPTDTFSSNKKEKHTTFKETSLSRSGASTAMSLTVYSGATFHSQNVYFLYYNCFHFSISLPPH